MVRSLWRLRPLVTMTSLPAQGLKGLAWYNIECRMTFWKGQLYRVHIYWTPHAGGYGKRSESWSWNNSLKNCTVNRIQYFLIVQFILVEFSNILTQILSFDETHDNWYDDMTRDDSKPFFHYSNKIYTFLFSYKFAEDSANCLTLWASEGSCVVARWYEE